MATPPLLTLSDISLAIGPAPLLGGVSLAVDPRARLCLLGRNGAGKSSLMRVIAGLEEPDGGERQVRPGTRIVYLPQEPDFGAAATLSEYVAAGLPADEPEAHHRIEAALEEIGLDGKRDPATLSGGEARRAALARAFVGRADLLLLDEPTNHLDLPAIEWLEAKLGAYRGAVILVSHDRAFLRRLASACLWLDRGRLKRLDAGFDAFDDWMEAELAREADDARKLDKRIAEETQWAREGITARRRRNQGRLRRLEELRAARRERLARPGAAALTASEGEVKSKLVIEAESITKRFGATTILDDFSTRIARGDRVGIVGPNGAGKTTLLKLLTGEIAPDSGQVRLAAGIRPLVVEQSRASLDPDSTPWETLTGGRSDQVMVRGRPQHVIAYLKSFLFAPEQAKSPVRILSGGEKNRLLLARELLRPSDLMVLDEPTNDLDMETLDLLQEMLDAYEGTVLLVSHDRDFLDRVATSTIVMEGQGRVVEYAGGYSDMLAQRGASSRPSETVARPAKTRKPDQRPREDKTGMERGNAPRMGYKEKRALETLPDEIAALEAEIAKLESALGDPGAYARAPDRYMLASERLETARKELAEKEEAWLALELKREETEGSG